MELQGSLSSVGLLQSVNQFIHIASYLEVFGSEDGLELLLGFGIVIQLGRWA